MSDLVERLRRASLEFAEQAEGENCGCWRDVLCGHHAAADREQQAADTIERLTRERDEARAQRDRWIEQCTRERDEARAEVGRLRAEPDKMTYEHLDDRMRLVEAQAIARDLAEILDGVASPLAIDGENHAAAVKHARAALARYREAVGETNEQK